MDNFRVNHKNVRVVKFEKSENQDVAPSSLRVVYLSENKFNVYKGEEETGDQLEAILLNAEVLQSKNKEGEIYIRT